MVKVTVCGAAGGIGQPLSLLLKQSKLVDHLALYDIVNAHGVAVELRHINTHSKVTSHEGSSQLEDAVKDADIVVVSAGVPRKPGMSRDDLFKINASIVRELSVAVAEFAPKALVCIISNPVNSTVPVVAEIFKKYGCYDAKKLFGITTLDSVRASTFLAELIGANPEDVHVPVIGGHSGVTIIPLLSRVSGSEKLTDEQLEKLTERIQYAGEEVLKAKDGKGTATLSMAYAGAQFVLKLIDAVANDVTHTECAYIDMAADGVGAKSIKRLAGNVEYFAAPIEFEKSGIKSILPVEKISTFEFKLFATAVPELKNNTFKGASFIKD
ncbi:malate dehydrogenase, NAD-dependent [Helicostylum pulchrum]|nr:malate dehydrogenase, NAD-dependent [Helicostylum pulchrum]